MYPSCVHMCELFVPVVIRQKSNCAIGIARSLAGKRPGPAVERWQQLEVPPPRTRLGGGGGRGVERIVEETGTVYLYQSHPLLDPFKSKACRDMY